MISICTPAHKIIPWWNLRLINICSQKFTDWEWIILDNSPDGRVSDYVGRFFTEMQGVKYPGCREKIKVFHEPFYGVKLADGRIGKLKNRCVELTSCSDNDFFVIFDFDDFLFDDFLYNLNALSETYPGAEYVSGICAMDLCQDITSGNFFYNDFVYKFFNLPPDPKHIKTLLKYGCGGIPGFEKYSGKYMSGETKIFNITDSDCGISIPYTPIKFSFGKVLRFSGKLGFSRTFVHPHCFRKGPFMRKLGGFCDTLPGEDCVHILAPYLFKTAYIDAPCYVQTVMTDVSVRIRMSGTTELEFCKNAKTEKNTTAYMKNLYAKIGAVMSDSGIDAASELSAFIYTP